MAPLNPRDGAFFDLSTRTKLRLVGNDRLRFLNGQITNNIATADQSSAIAACVLNAKGRMNAHIFLSAPPDSLWLDAAADLRETLKSRLERYIIADDVQIDELSDQFSIFHLLVRAIPHVPKECRLVSANRFGQSGFDLWVDADRREELFQQLRATLPFCDDGCAEVFRIEQGIPRWGRELTEEIIPVEANLEESCVDYEKGCYIGQEVISRMKMSGQRSKSLCGLVAAPGPELIPGMRLFSSADPAKEVGWITSAVRSVRLDRVIALGYVKRGHNVASTELDAGAVEGSARASTSRVKVVNLPFVPEGSV